MHNASAPSSSGSVPPKVGPPLPVGASPTPDATVGSVRRTAVTRPLIVPTLVEGADDGVPATHPYVRTFWIPIIGPGAVADLCRLTAAAQRGRPLKLPLHVTALARRGLVTRGADSISVVASVRSLTPAESRSLPPGIRLQHQRFIARRSRKGV